MQQLLFTEFHTKIVLQGKFIFITGLLQNDLLNQHAFMINVALLVCCLYDQVNRQAILDAVLAEAVAILQDLPCKNQNQLVLFGFEPPRDLFFKLKDSNEERLDRK